MSRLNWKFSDGNTWQAACEAAGLGNYYWVIVINESGEFSVEESHFIYDGQARQCLTPGSVAALKSLAETLGLKCPALNLAKCWCDIADGLMEAKEPDAIHLTPEWLAVEAACVRMQEAHSAHNRQSPCGDYYNSPECVEAKKQYDEACRVYAKLVASKEGAT